MATYTDNYQLTLPTYAEVADIATINNNMTKIDEIMHDSQISIATAYDASTTSENPYNTGDIVMYEKIAYKCKYDGVYGTWDASKWEQTTLADNLGGGDASEISYDNTTSGLTADDVQEAIDELEGNIEDVSEGLDDAVESLAPAYDSTEAYNEGDIVSYENKLYECNTDNTTGSWDSQYWDEYIISEHMGATVTITPENIEEPKQKIADFEIDGASGSLYAPIVEIEGHASGAIASFPDGSNNKPLKSLKVAINPVQASGTPTPSTPLPISGWTGADVENQGIYKRCIATIPQTYNSNGITMTTSSTGKIDIRGTSTANINFTFAINPFTIPSENGRRIRFHNDFVSSSTSIVFRNGNTNIDSWSLNSLNRSQTYTALADKYIDIIQISISSGQTINGSLLIDFVVDEHGTTYPITWSEAGEVFGGEIEYSDLVWSAERTQGKLDMSDFSVSDLNSGAVNQTTGMIRYITPAISDKAMERADMLCNIFPTKATTGYDTDTTETISGNSANKAIYIVIDSNRLSGDLTTKEGRATALINWIANNPMYIVYNLETPIPFTLDEPLPTITSLLGNNNIWSDTGDIEECIYQRDLNIVINQFDARITALEQALSGTRNLSLSKSAVKEEETKEESKEEEETKEEQR